MANILFLNFSPRARIDLRVHSGSSSGTASLVRGLQAAGHEVISAISGERKRELRARATFRRLKHLLPPAASTMISTLYEIAHDRIAYSDLADLSRNSPVDLVYERFAPFHQGASELARLLRTPYIVEIHGPSSDRAEFGPGYFAQTADRIQEAVIRRADAVRVISSAVKTYYHKRGIPPSKMHVLPNAANAALFDPGAADAHVRSKLELAGKTVVGFVGSMQAYHGLGILLEAASTISKRVRRVHFLIVGPISEGFRTAVEQERLTDFFTLTGALPHEEVPQYVRAMDICVVPDSNWYGSPIKLFEYGAMGKPVVAPRLGPVEDVVTHRQSALLFPPSDVQGFARAVLDLVRDQGLREHVASNWREQVRTKHTWDRRAREIMGLYESLA